MTADTTIFPKLLHRDFARVAKFSSPMNAMGLLSSRLGNSLTLRILDAGLVVKLEMSLPATPMLQVDANLYVPTPPSAISILQELNLSPGTAFLRVGKADNSAYLQCPIGLKPGTTLRMTSTANLAVGVNPSLGAIIFGLNETVPNNLVPTVGGGYRSDDANYKRLWGPGLAIASVLADISVGRRGGLDQIVSQRFRAPRTMTVASIRQYLTGYVGYALGTGGTIRARIFPDAAGLPNLAATVIAEGQRAMNLVAGAFQAGDNAYNPINFTGGLKEITGGTLYHVVYDQMDGSPAANWCGLDFIATKIGYEKSNRWLADSELGVLFGYRAGGTADPFVFDDFTNVGNLPVGLRYAPCFEIMPTTGAPFGVGTVQSGDTVTPPPVRLYSRDTAIRYQITPTSARRIDGISVRTAASKPGTLKLQLMQGTTELFQADLTQAVPNFGTASQLPVTLAADIALSGLAAGVAEPQSPPQPYLMPRLDASDNTIRRLTDVSLITSVLSFSAAQIATPKTIGFKHTGRYQETADRRYLLIDQIGAFGAGNAAADKNLVISRETGIPQGSLPNTVESWLANNVATPTRRYFIEDNGGSANRFGYDNLPAGAQKTILDTFTAYSNLTTRGKGRQSTADTRLALLGTRTDATGSDLLIINPVTGAIITTIALAGYFSAGGSKNIDFCTISGDGAYAYLGVNASLGTGPIPAGVVNAVAIFDATSGAYLRKTDNESLNGDAAKNSAGVEGWAGIDASGAVSASEIKFWPATGAATTVQLAAGPTARDSQLLGIYPGAPDRRLAWIRGCGR